MKTSVALMGASGMVGQSIITALADDPTFEIVEVISSEKRQGKVYEAETNWLLLAPCPEKIKALTFKSLEDLESPYVISALPADAAETMEPALADKGHIVFSNAAAHRLSDKAVMIVPEINREVLKKALPAQNKGMIVTNPNCVVAIVSLALAPFYEAGLVKTLSMTTLQSASGAGYPGVSSMDLLGNVVPYIQDEECKIIAELRQLFQVPNQPISVQCNRVPVRVGHMASIELELTEPLSVVDAQKIITQWGQSHDGMLIFHDDPTAPQPLKSLSANDMRVHVGRLQTGLTDRHIRFCALGDNLTRGAAGAAIANMNLYHHLRR